MGFRKSLVRARLFVRLGLALGKLRALDRDLDEPEYAAALELEVRLARDQLPDAPEPVAPVDPARGVATTR